MIKLDLGTFGAVMKFAMELESKSLSFYEGAVEKAAGDELRSLLSLIKEKCDKRIATLERVRRENVTEMILEPITGLDSGSYKPVTSIPDSPDDKALQGIALEIEKSLHSFYVEAGAKIDFLSEVAYSFEILAEANEESIERLS